MFSLPATRLSSVTNSPTTFVSARALIRCTVVINRSTRVSVSSRCRQCRYAASRVSLSSSGWSRSRLGVSTATRERHATSIFGATSANKVVGSPIARTASSLDTSSTQVSRLTFPGSVLIRANTSAPPSPPSTGSVSASPSKTRIRAVADPGIPAAMWVVSACSAWRIADPTIRAIRVGPGGSSSSSRHRASSSSRTQSSRGSAWHTSSVSHSVSLAASVTVGSRNPVSSRICARCRWICRPCQS